MLNHSREQMWKAYKLFLTKLTQHWIKTWQNTQKALQINLTID